MQLATTLCAALLGASLAPTVPAADTCAAGQAYAAAGEDIVATAVEAGKSETLAAALEAAGPVGALQGEGPFTVFARLPKGALENLPKPENKALLVNVPTYHVVLGKVTAEQVVKLRPADALDGQRLPIRIEDGTVIVAGAQVVTADVQAKNGVIHVLDSVLLPAAGR